MPKMGDAMEEGTLLKWLKSEGEEVPERSEGGAEEEAEEGGEEDGGGTQATATETEAPEEDETEEAGGQADGRADGHFRASPIVRRLAEENDLDLSKIVGSGPAGRIVERDVRAAMESGTAQRTEDGAADGVAAPEQPRPQQAEMQGFQPARLPEPTEEPGTQLVEPTRMMQVIGERMTEAKQHVPHFYATVEG